MRQISTGKIEEKELWVRQNTTVINPDWPSVPERTTKRALSCHALRIDQGSALNL
jgi:hypothetical protein